MPTAAFVASELRPPLHAQNAQYDTVKMQAQPSIDGKHDSINIQSKLRHKSHCISRAVIAMLLLMLGFLSIFEPYPLYASRLAYDVRSDRIRPPPRPEKIEVAELPLPPVAPSSESGSCTLEINPRGTGCIAQGLEDSNFQAGDFTPDGDHVVITVKFVGTRKDDNPASVYDGEQLVLLKADGTTFENGDTWKCLTCGVSDDHKDVSTDYPHVFRSGDKALWGHNIIDCNGHQFISDECMSNKINIFPIYWANIRHGTEIRGAFRELRLHPDDTHLGFSSFDEAGGQSCFVGRLMFNISAKRYDLTNVNLLHHPTRSQQITIKDSELFFHEDVIRVGELRGFSGTGDEILYIGPSVEANNIDVFAVHVITGAVRRLTQHPEYVDPVAFSADNNWMVAMDTRGSNRQMFMSGMRHVPPLVDLLAITAAASTRNNGARRFFQPYLIDRFGDRGEYYGQQVNSQGDGRNGAVNDPNWNARADPAFSRDGTKIVYWQAIAKGRECGCENPLPCPVPTTQGQREYRLMLAKLMYRMPTTVPPVFEIPDVLPWATPFAPNSTLPPLPTLEPGSYILHGKISGTAHITASGSPNSIHAIAVNYTNFADVKGYVLNGWENVTRAIQYPNVWDNLLDWYSDIEQTGHVNATKKTSADGFHLHIDAMTNIFAANGSLKTTIDGMVYEQSANGT